MKPITELENIYALTGSATAASTGSAIPCAVLGGGPSLPGDLEKVRRALPPFNSPQISQESIWGDARQGRGVLIAVNDHALAICEPDYMVFMDEPHKVPELWQAVQTTKAIKVSQGQYSDVDLGGVRWWDGGFSSSLAVWLACYMGCDPVLLCGMDCYQGEQKHLNPRTVDHPSFYYPLENYFRAWYPAFERVPGIERVKAVSGPLVEVFGQADL